MFDFTAGANSLLSDMTVSYSAANTGNSFLTKWGVNGNISNVEFIDTCTSSATSGCFAIDMSTASVTVNIVDSSYAGSGDAGYHWFGNVIGATTELNIRRCNATNTGGDSATLGNVLVYSSGAASRVVNIYDSHFASDSATTGGTIYNGGTTTVYNSTIDSSGATSFDVKNTANTLTLYDTTLVNNTTSGTITQAGTVITLRVSADVVMTALTTSPDAIEGTLFWNKTDKTYDAFDGTNWRELQYGASVAP